MTDRTEAMEHVIHSSMPIDFERRYAMDNLIAQDADLIDTNDKDSAVLAKAYQAVERLAHTQMDLSLSEWSNLSGAILAALRQPTQSDALREALEFYAAGIGHTEIEDNGAIARKALEARGLEIREKNDA